MKPAKWCYTTSYTNNCQRPDEADCEVFPNNIPKPIVDMSVPKINLINSDFPLGVEILSLIASIGLTWEAFLATAKATATVTPL